jgi:hypothetical protein
MEEGKEFMRSFGDLLQFHQKKKEQEKPTDSAESSGASNGSGSDTPEPKVESHQSE